MPANPKLQAQWAQTSRLFKSAPFAPRPYTPTRPAQQRYVLQRFEDGCNAHIQIFRHPVQRVDEEIGISATLRLEADFPQQAAKTPRHAQVALEGESSRN